MWRDKYNITEVEQDDLKSLKDRGGYLSVESGGDAMKKQHKAIRALLTTMAPRRAVEYIKSFELPQEEELFLIECDVRRKSYVQVSMEYHASTEVIKRRKQTAYSKIADQLNH